jgi:cell division septation protein DedD
MSQYDPRDFYEPGNQAGNQQGNQPNPEDARYMPRDLRVEPREYQRGSSRPNPDARPRAQRRRLLAPILAVVGLMVFFAIVWFAWSSSQTTTGEGGMPLIKADNTPTKMRPEQPGGMAVPHQDKLIYDRLKADTGNNETAAVERLLPPPENPLPRPEAPPPPEAIEEPPVAGLPPTASGAPVPLIHSMPNSEQPGLSETPASPPVAATPAPPPPVATRPAPPPPQAAAPAAPPRAVTPPPPAPTQTAALPPPSTPPATSSGGGSFRLQIASVKSEDAARAEFQRLQKRYPEALGGLGVAYVRVDLGDKGIYYRVQAGPVDEARATSICSSLKSQSVGCILVRQ